MKGIEIKVRSYGHSDDSWVGFEREFIVVTEVSNGGFIEEEDFDRIYNAIQDVDQKEFIDSKEGLYEFSMFRVVEDQGIYDNSDNVWFNIQSVKLIKI